MDLYSGGGGGAIIGRMFVSEITWGGGAAQSFWGALFLMGLQSRAHLVFRLFVSDWLPGKTLG